MYRECQQKTSMRDLSFLRAPLFVSSQIWTVAAECVYFSWVKIFFPRSDFFWWNFWFLWKKVCLKTRFRACSKFMKSGQIQLRWICYIERWEKHVSLTHLLISNQSLDGRWLIRCVVDNVLRSACSRKLWRRFFESRGKLQNIEMIANLINKCFI